MIVRFSFLVDNGKCYHTGKPGIGMEDLYYLMACDLDDCDDVWEKLYNHYYANKEFCFEVEFAELLTVRDIQKMISDRIGFIWSRFLDMPLHTAFFCDGQLVHIKNHEIKLCTIQKWYDIGKEIALFLFSVIKQEPYGLMISFGITCIHVNQESTILRIFMLIIETTKKQACR